MGQVLVVHGSDSVAVGQVYGKLLTLFDQLCAIRPAGEVRSGCTMAAQFPKLAGEPAGPVRGGAATPWAVAAGTWFYGDAAGYPALASLSRDFQQQGQPDALLPKLDGFFGLVLPGAGEDEILALTDRLGILHLYEAQIGGCLVLATSALVLAAALEPAWDATACREFLALGNVFENRSLFQGVEKLAPASVYRYRRGERIERRTWWSQAEASFDWSKDRGDVPLMAEALEQSMQRIAGALQRPLLDLTGGFDSRILYGAALRAGVRIPTMVAGPPNDPDVLCARRIVREMGTEDRHLHIEPDPPTCWIPRLRHALRFCDGECDLFYYARILDTHQRLARDYHATVNGSLGGILKGLWWELLWPHTGEKEHFDEYQVASRRIASSRENRNLLATGFPETLTEHFAGVIRRANVAFEGHLNTAKMDNTYMRIRLHRWMGRTASSTMRLWDCVTPFALRRPMEVMLSAPVKSRARFRMARSLIEYQSPKLAALPVAEGYPALPLRWNTLYRFGPLLAERWNQVASRMTRKSMRLSGGAQQGAHEIWKEEEAHELLAPASMRTAGLYRPEELHRLIEESRGEGFGRREALQRVVALELLAQTVHGAHRAIAASRT